MAQPWCRWYTKLRCLRLAYFLHQLGGDCLTKGLSSMDSTNAAHKPLVAILNTSPDFMEVVSELLDTEAFRSVADYIVEYRKGRKDIRAFFNEHQPQVIIYDVALPYTENWAFFEHVRSVSRLRNCQFIIVTTNKKALEALVGPTSALEIIGKPFDFDALIAAVTKSLDQCR